MISMSIRWWLPRPYVGKSIVMKRFMPAAAVALRRIEKPFSNLTIVVREVEAKGEAA
jgi:large subunit ribosomal protein L22